METDIDEKGKDTLLMETGIGGKGKGLFLVETCYALMSTTNRPSIEN
jgi:hypothetical protein